MQQAFNNLFSKPNKSDSLAHRLRFSFFVILILMVIPVLVSIWTMQNYAGTYHRAIMQVDSIASLRPIVNEEIPDEMWSIVAGRITFENGSQYTLIDEINSTLDSLLSKYAGSASMELTVARRTMDTLASYIDKMGSQIQQGALVSQNEALLEEVRSVSSLVGDMLEQYITVEISAATQTSQALQQQLVIIMIVMFVLLIATYTFSILAQRSLSRSISTPISQLEQFAGLIADGKLNVRVQKPQVQELTGLTDSLNIMAIKLQQLIDENKKEQENLKRSELRALQAQVAPHFLYNTLDAIVWMAEAQRTDEVIHLTRALSDFFRISLSDGRDWIPLSNEVKHLQGYLTIQKVRYRDILDYEIDIPTQLHDKQILKLLLQPLVENAIYHGIKHRRGRGTVKVTGKLKDNKLQFCVTDNGAGMTKERLMQVRESLNKDCATDEQKDCYGLYNVNKRIQLYYNQITGLEIESDENGTTVSFCVPC